MNQHITVPFSGDEAKKLKAGDYVYISGTIYTARDAAHKRMYEAVKEGKELPLSVADNVIYYMGPSPAREGAVIGAAGPTTASRMDKYAPSLLDLGLKGMIGKGKRSPEVIESIKKNKAVYLVAIGGLGALISKSIESVEVVGYDFLGTESVKRMKVKDFPVIVAIDSMGNNIYQE